MAVWVTLAIGLYEMQHLGLPYLQYFQYSAWADGPARLMLHIAGVLAIAGVQAWFLYAALISSRTWKVLYFSLFTWVTFVEFGYVKAGGGLTNAHDIDVALDNTKYWRAMAGAFVDWSAAIPAVVLLMALVVSRPRPAGHLRRFLTALLAMVLVHSSYAASGYLHGAPDVGMASGAPVPTGSFQAFARAITLCGWNRAAARLDHHVRQQLPATGAAPPSGHVVLIIDESISAGHLSLDGYPRETTPWLEGLARQGRLTNWGVASSATNNSNGSVLCILTGVNQLPDLHRDALQHPTLFQYAKAMHYGTHLLDGEAARRRFGLSWQDLAFVDDFRTAGAFGDDPETDFKIAHAVREVLRESEGQFVVVLKRGNHFPHQKNYPAARGTWPVSNDAVSRDAAPDALTNAYDNAIRYNLDAFFQVLLGQNGSLPRTVVLYTSDHGEVLSGEGTEPLSRNLAWGIVSVPLFMVGDNRTVVDPSYRASHHNIFPTLLDLMGVPEPLRTGGLSRSLLKARGTDRDSRIVFGGFLFDAQYIDVRDFDALTRPASLGPSR